MARLNAADVAQSWARGMTASTAKIKAGVQAVTESPMQKAASKQDAYVAGVQRAAESGKWADGLRSVSLEQWKEATATKGTGRIQAGVTQAVPKMEEFMAQLLPHAEQVSKEVAQLPKGGVENGIARATLAIRRMADFKRRRRT